MGYESTTAMDILLVYKAYLENKVGEQLLPGEGARILSLVSDVIFFVNSTFSDPQDIRNATAVTLDIVDKVLMHPHSVINETVSWVVMCFSFRRICGIILESLR